MAKPYLAPLCHVRTGSLPTPAEERLMVLRAMADGRAWTTTLVNVDLYRDRVRAAVRSLHLHGYISQEPSHHRGTRYAYRITDNGRKALGGHR